LLHPESPVAPRETEDDLGSPDGFRPKSERKREAGGVTGPFPSVRIKKRDHEGLPGDMAGDALSNRLTYSSHLGRPLTERAVQLNVCKHLSYFLRND
jgi:hypothetical protein